MSIPQLIKAFNGIPRREEVANALASTRAYQNHGHIEYDVAQAGEALVAYYQRMENSAMVRHNRRTKKESMFSLEVANRFKERAKAVESRLKELMEDEDRQADV